MSEIKFKIISVNKGNVSQLERIRYQAYNLEFDEKNFKNSYYANKLIKGTSLAFGSYVDDKLVGGCYISSTYSSLYIDQLFIIPAYQKSKLHLGSSLLKYVLSQKEELEKVFKLSFIYSCLEAYDGTDEFYAKAGYRKRGSLMRKLVNQVPSLQLKK